MRVSVVFGVFAAAGILCCPEHSTMAGSSEFTLSQRPDRVEIALDGRPFTAFHFNPKWDKPFLHPIRTVSGTIISRGWPVEPREGDEQDHAWHRGIWYGHGDINGEDFWREKPDRTTARLVLIGEPKVTSGTQGILEATLAMTGAKGNRLGTIAERYEFRRESSQVLIASTIAVTAGQGLPLKFGDTEDGGFGFRLSTEFRQDRGAELVNSEGLRGTERIWGRQARWVKYRAVVDGAHRGVAVLDHPSNLRHPSGWHARGYGLCSANPFAAGSFSSDKKLDGSYILPAGQTLKLRYLVVVFDGDLETDAANRLFARFARE
jgi:hypothetical protein